MDFDGAGAKQSRKDDRLPDETWFESWSGYHLPICYADLMPMMPVSARWDPMGPYGTLWDPGGRKAAAASCRLGGPRGPGPGHPGTGVRGIPGPSGAGARAGPPAFSHPPPPSFTVRNISSAHVTFSSCLSFTPTTVPSGCTNSIPWVAVKRTSSSRKYSLIASHPSRTLWNDSSSNPQAPCFFVCATKHQRK